MDKHWTEGLSGQFVIDRMGGQYQLYVECVPAAGMTVSQYGGSHGFMECSVPMKLCRGLSQPDGDAYISLALFQVKHIQHGQQPGDARSTTQVVPGGVPRPS